MKTCVYKQVLELFFLVLLLTGVGARRCFWSTPSESRITGVDCGRRSCMIVQDSHGLHRECACGSAATGTIVWPGFTAYYCNEEYCNLDFPPGFD